MINLEESITIKRPLEQVFAYLCDGKNELHWSSGLVDIRQIPDGPMSTGTVITEVRNFMGVRIESRSQIVEYEPNKKFVRKGSAPFPIEGSFLFEPLGQGTKVTWTMHVEPSGFFKVAEPLVAGNLKKEIVANLHTIKGLLEN